VRRCLEKGGGEGEGDCVAKKSAKALLRDSAALPSCSWEDVGADVSNLSGRTSKVHHIGE